MKLQPSRRRWQKTASLCLAGIVLSLCYFSAGDVQAGEVNTIYVSVGQHRDVGVGYGWLPKDNHKLVIVLHAQTGDSSTIGWKIKKSWVNGGSGASLWHVKGSGGTTDGTGTDAPETTNNTPANIHIYEGVGLNKGVERELLADENHSVAFHGELLTTGPGTGVKIPKFDVTVVQVNIHSSEVDANKETAEDLSANSTVGLIIDDWKTTTPQEIAAGKVTKKKITITVHSLKPGKVSVVNRIYSYKASVTLSKKKVGPYTNGFTYRFNPGDDPYEIWVRATGKEKGEVRVLFLADKPRSGIAEDKLSVSTNLFVAGVSIVDHTIVQGDTSAHRIPCTIRNTTGVEKTFKWKVEKVYNTPYNSGLTILAPSSGTLKIPANTRLSGFIRVKMKSNSRLGEFKLRLEIDGGAAVDRGVVRVIPTGKNQWIKQAIRNAGITGYMGTSGETSEILGDWAGVKKHLDRREALSRIYKYYAKLYESDRKKYLWAGLAANAGSVVLVDGVDRLIRENLYIRANYYGPIPDANLKIRHEMVGILSDMAVTIFLDIAWQFEAYNTRGISEIKRLRDNGVLSSTYYSAWLDIDSSKTAGIITGNQTLALREQVYILRPGYKKINCVESIITGGGLLKGAVAKKMSYEAFSGLPGVVRFRDYLPKGSITDTDIPSIKNDRWKWVDTQILVEWKRITEAARNAIVSGAITKIVAETRLLSTPRFVSKAALFGF